MLDNAATTSARALLQHAVTARIFPAATAEVGDSERPLWREAFGRLTFDDAAPATNDTIFDLASLTKPIATATVIMRLAADGALSFTDPVASLFEDWRGADREDVTIRELLEHASGLAARLVDPPPLTRREFEHEIGTMKLEYLPRTKSIYSDLGFILLGFIAEDRGGTALNRLWERSRPQPRIDEWLAFGVGDTLQERVAPTMPEPNDARRGRRLTGEVHDDYAAALDGVAGHAGMFGNTAGVGSFARTMLRAARGDRTITRPLSAALVEQMTVKSSVPGSSRALGWDTMLPTSSCGTELSPAAFGHVGFTGTSLWIDPILFPAQWDPKLGIHVT